MIIQQILAYIIVLGIIAIIILKNKNNLKK